MQMHNANIVAGIIREKAAPSCPFFEGKANYSSTGTHIWQQILYQPTPPKNYTCASNVVGVLSLQCPADQSIKWRLIHVDQSIILYLWKRALKMEFVGQEILGLKLLEHDYYSDDDVSAHSHSDPNILMTVKKADFVEFWMTIAQLLEKIFQERKSQYELPTTY